MTEDLKPRRRKLWMGVGAVVLVTAGGAGLFLSRRQAPVQPVLARSGPVVQTVVASGRVRAPARMALSTTASGLVRQVLVLEGAHVRLGQPLVLLVDDEARALLDQAQAAAEQARAKLQQLRQVARPLGREGVRQADAQSTRARKSMERASKLRTQESNTVVEEEDARTTLTLVESQGEVAATQLQAAQPGGADLRTAQAQLQSALATVHAAQARLAMLHVDAPANGLILSRTVEPGQVVGPASVLLVMTPDGPVQLTVLLDERNLATVNLQARALASADAFQGQPFEAVVQFLAPQVDPGRGTVEVRLDVPNPPAFLRPEMTVSVEIETGRTGDALTVPSETVQNLAAADPSVLVLHDGHVLKRPVTLGLQGQGVVEVTHGLVEGESVVAPRDGLKAGARVRVAPAKSR